MISGAYPPSERSGERALMASTAPPLTILPARSPWRMRRTSVVGLMLMAPLALLIVLFLIVPLFRFVVLSVDNRP
jgi:hypothetical protein